MKLAALGIPQVYDIETTHGGHSWTYFEHKLPEAMKFLVERLEAEQRRVL
jgi:S-formylglutathione hydrolase FrmB